MIRTRSPERDTVPSTTDSTFSLRAISGRGLRTRLSLERLPVDSREIIVLRELEDLSYKEIADIVEVPMGTVMSRLARARKLLREQLEQMNAQSQL